MGISDQQHHPTDTQEFLAMWSAAKEEHFAQELAPMLPLLLGTSDNVDATRLQEGARHLVRAMHLAATPEGGLHGALEYLAKIAGSHSEASRRR